MTCVKLAYELSPQALTVHYFYRIEIRWQSLTTYDLRYNGGP